MKNMRVGEIMIPLDKYPHVPYNFTLGQAMAVLQQAVLVIGGKNSLPREILVFDQDYNLMGTAGRRDILRGLEPDFLVEKPLESRMELFSTGIDAEAQVSIFEKVLDSAREHMHKPVSDVMRPIRASVDYDDHIFKAIYLMNSQRTSILPVIRDDEVAGVARTVDVFDRVVELLIQEA